MSWCFIDGVSGDLWCKRCGEALPFPGRPIGIETAVAMAAGFERAHSKCRDPKYPEDVALAYYDPHRNNNTRLVEIVDFCELIDMKDRTSIVQVRYLNEGENYFAVRACVLKPVTPQAADILRGGSKETGFSFTIGYSASP